MAEDIQARPDLEPQARALHAGTEETLRVALTNVAECAAAIEHYLSQITTRPLMVDGFDCVSVMEGLAARCRNLATDGARLLEEGAGHV